MYNIMFHNLLYAAIGGLITIVFMFISIKILDVLIPFNTFDHLRDDNISVALVFSSVIIAVGISMGFVIGYALN